MLGAGMGSSLSPSEAVLSIVSSAAFARILDVARLGRTLQTLSTSLPAGDVPERTEEVN
jgi:hypothetical protein